MQSSPKLRLGVVALCLTLASVLLLPAGGYAENGAVIGSEPSSHDFGDVVEKVQIVTEVFRITNTGTSDLVVDDLRIVGKDAADFWLGLIEWPFTLGPGESQGFWVSFSPSSAGPKSAALRVKSNAENENPFYMPLSGNGLPLSVLGKIYASAVPNNSAPHPGDIITVAVVIDMTSANPPGDILRTYEATLRWDASVLVFYGFFLGDAPWRAPTSIGPSDGYVRWNDTVWEGAGGKFTVIRLRFKVVGEPESNTALDLEFERLEGEDIENLLPILNTKDGYVEVQGDPAMPDIAVKPNSYDYGMVPLGTSASKTFVVRNTGTADLEVKKISLKGLAANQFSLDNDNGPFTLAPGKSRGVKVSFNPTSEGLKSCQLVIQSNDPDEPIYNVPLRGSVSVPDIAVDPSSLAYGDVELGVTVSKTLKVTNEGNAPLQLTQFGLEGHKNQFSYDSHNLAILAPGESGNIEVFFHPTSEGEKNATFLIYSNDPDESPVEVPLSGTGVTEANAALASNPGSVSAKPTSLIEAERIKKALGERLHMSYPNPFNPATQIVFSLSKAAHVRVEVYNILGQRIVTLMDQRAEAGLVSVTWNTSNTGGRKVSSGYYLYRVIVDNSRTFSGKMLLLK